MFLSRGDRDLGVAFQTHPGRQAFISSGSNEPRSALEWRRVSLETAARVIRTEKVRPGPSSTQNPSVAAISLGERLNSYNPFGNGVHSPLGLSCHFHDPPSPCDVDSSLPGASPQTSQGSLPPLHQVCVQMSPSQRLWNSLSELAASIFYPQPTLFFSTEPFQSDVLST